MRREVIKDKPLKGCTFKPKLVAKQPIKNAPLIMKKES